MLYNGKTLQKESCKETDSAYRQAESHSNKNEEVQSEDNKVVTQSFSCNYKNKEIKVTVEFPKQSDMVAEQEFKSRLKEIYLEKIRLGAMQISESALTCQPNESTEV